jgi:hypothetical protein
MRRWLLAVLAIVLIVLALSYLGDWGPIDACLDHGARWNYAQSKCECTPEELASPTVTKEFIAYCETPAPAPGR